MVSTILVPLDGSKFAEAALAPAASLARAAGARLYLSSVHVLAGVMAGVGELALIPARVDEEVRHEEEQYLAETASRLGDLDRGSVRTLLVDGLSVGETVCDQAGGVGADLIVMATHGRGAMGRLWLGGVADYVVRHSNRPVLLINPGHTRKPVPEVRNILVALDPTDYSEAILDPVVIQARLTGSRVTLLTIVAPVFGIAEPVLPPPLPQHPGIMARRSDEARARLAVIADALKARGLDVRTRVAVATTPAGGILSVLQEPGFDMLALTTHGRSGVERLLVGSVAEKVMRAAPKPLLIYRPSFL